MIDIMIADDNKKLSKITKEILSQNVDFNIVGQAYTGIDTIKRYLTLNPDILLLDIDMPDFNGIEVLHFLCHYSLEEQSKCNILIVSAKLSNYSLKDAVKVFSVIEKPFEWNKFIKTIYDCYDFQKAKSNIKLTHQKVNSTLKKLKFDISHKGTKYLNDAILLVNESYDYLFSVDDLYKKIAKKYSTTPYKVK